MRYEICKFCAKRTYPGYGKKYIANNGRIFRFCRRKCSIDYIKNRNLRKIPWENGNNLAIDLSFEFERCRRDEQYFRKLVRKLKKLKEKGESYHVMTRFRARQIKQVEKIMIFTTTIRFPSERVKERRAMEAAQKAAKMEEDKKRKTQSGNRTMSLRSRSVQVS